MKGLLSHEESYATSPNKVELHGFCDAYEVAYRSCVYTYIRNIHSGQEHTVKLLCAKSQVTPIKKLLPRLELCGAVLLTNLCKRITQALSIQIDNMYYWSDSTIVLLWVMGEAINGTSSLPTE